MSLELLKDYWLNILSDEFNRGYVTAVIMLFALLLLWLFVRICFRIIFRRKRCNHVIVPMEDGNLNVSSNAIGNVVMGALESFEQLELRKILLYRRGKNYILQINGTFNVGKLGLVETTKEVKSLLFKTLEETLGVKLISICFQVNNANNSSNNDEEKITEPSESENVHSDVEVVSPIGNISF